MIVEYIRYAIPPDRQDAFERGYAEAAVPLAASSHCLGYELSRCADDPTRYVLRIEWDSAEGHLQGFRRSPEFRAFFAAVRPFVDDITEMRHYAPTAVRSAAARAPTG
jgi:quinol monooxygenase YgiN